MRGKLAIIGILGLIIGGASVGGVMFAIVIGDLSTLRNSYTDLEQDYSDLEQDYNNLTTEYNDMFGDYLSLSNVIEDPLTNPVVPTYNQVISWLASDDTDTHDYVNDTWVCGDFASMLMVRAKEMNWRMRIAVMFYSLSGDAEYGTDDPYGSYGHAFNFIYCQDGSDPDSELDLYYIEPQTDTVWYVYDGSDNLIHYTIYTSYSGINGTVWENGSYWVNHYGYFA